MKKEIKLALPLICTRGVIVFPEMTVNFDVGREKSINAVNESKERFDSHVFIVCQKDIYQEVSTYDGIYKIGTICKITGVRKKDGILMVQCIGVERAKLVDYDESGEFLVAQVTPLHDEPGDYKEEAALVNQLASEIEKFGNNSKLVPREMAAKMATGISAVSLSHQFSQLFPFSIEARQELLEMVSINDRLFTILKELENEKEIADIESEINEKVRVRLENGQREYYLREKMRLIKEELGDVSNITDDAAKLREMIENNPYPEHVKLKAQEELQRYESLPASSGEASVLRGYLDWLLKTPWYGETEDNSDLNDVQRCLDEEHYGLEKVKERIMEYLAVKEMTNSLKAPILCLVGPPGVGKTSLGKSVASALNRKFVKISLGGVKDESEIRGHRRTYLGSMPGRIIQGMKTAGVKNPVFLIDEIDKMGSDYKGDPSSAMLEVLDPEQNKMFSDHYLEEPYDLSNVMFIATANYLENIPPALQDRLEIINLSSYTELEKMNIATSHLVPKQIEMNGLKSSQFKITDKELLYLIRHYTREAGVRQLERVIASLCRKTVLSVLKEKKKSVKITKKLILTWLGNEKFEYGRKESSNQIGVVTGLAYTSFGGDVLPVEVTYFEGNGKFVVTGYLGDVMKESTMIALDYIKSNANKYKIDPDFFNKHDIHIHVPEGAIPKDGPSAGVTLTTAIISAITKTPVSSKVAMTGEVTLRGRVLAIGGLREKSLAAHRVGIRRVIMPKSNLKDIDEFPAILKEDMEFIPVETIDQVLKEALV